MRRLIGKRKLPVMDFCKSSDDCKSKLFNPGILSSLDYRFQIVSGMGEAYPQKEDEQPECEGSCSFWGLESTKAWIEITQSPVEKTDQKQCTDALQ